MTNKELEKVIAANNEGISEALNIIADALAAIDEGVALHPMESAKLTGGIARLREIAAIEAPADEEVVEDPETAQGE